MTGACAGRCGDSPLADQIFENPPPPWERVERWNFLNQPIYSSINFFMKVDEIFLEWCHMTATTSKESSRQRIFFALNLSFVSVGSRPRHPTYFKLLPWNIINFTKILFSIPEQTKIIKKPLLLFFFFGSF